VAIVVALDAFVREPAAAASCIVGARNVAVWMCCSGGVHRVRVHDPREMPR
jgi:hypothetical protein